MENLPIDIHSNKLLDWLISRRHCPRNWQDSVDAIRPKISHAIQDMPENEQIVAILSGGQYINYFHCKQILAILHDTEKDTKNMFGFYSSQRVKDWKEIISLYERENVYLGEAAKFLQRFVQYEVPAIRRQIAKAENTNRESARKEQDYARQATENRRAFERELTKWGLTAEQGGDLRRSLLAQADGQSPAQLPILPELAKALAYFEHFSEYIGQDTTDMFPLIRLLASANAAGRPVDEVTVYEWKHGRVPEAVIPQARLHFSAEAEPTKEEDEIDFGDDDGTEADIDFCTNGGADSSASGDGIQIVSVEEGDHLATTISEPTSTSGVDGIARGQDAIPVLDHPTALGHFLDELEQLMAFLHFRHEDEEADNVAGIYLAGLAQKPVELMREGDQVPGWLEAFKRTATELGDPQRLQLLRIRSSQSFVDEIVSQLEHKRRLEFKYRQMERLANERQQKCAQEMREADHLLARLIEAAKQLQENLEADISKRYNGREVYIMGEINAVLYGS